VLAENNQFLRCTEYSRGCFFHGGRLWIYEFQGNKKENSMNELYDLLECQHPVILGAMGNICNPELVAAVSEAGALGVMATAFAPDPEFVRGQIKETKKLTQKPFGANLQVMSPHTPRIAEILAEEDIGIVTVSGGSPKKLIPYLHERGIRVMVVVPTVSVAKKAADIGADAIIAEGSESGGIQGFNGVSTMVLVPAVVDAVNIPVIAAGGIGDSRGFKAALALGPRGSRWEPGLLQVSNALPT
jgi:enoyl-[acyl-carrier protein] reductase II